ncbi:MAG: hypothetical protein ACI4HI_18215 [Lachnospiraceae bacterium]
MFLTSEKSLCKKDAKVVVSKDKGSQVQHRAENPKKFDLRHYKLDGGIFTQVRCCDYLLVDDNNRKAYFIELKGENIDDAVEQLEAGERNCKNELEG